MRHRLWKMDGRHKGGHDDGGIEANTEQLLGGH